VKAAGEERVGSREKACTGSGGFAGSEESVAWRVPGTKTPAPYVLPVPGAISHRGPLEKPSIPPIIRKRPGNFWVFIRDTPEKRTGMVEKKLDGVAE
jgi:hypothetical protein